MQLDSEFRLKDQCLPSGDGLVAASTMPSRKRLSWSLTHSKTKLETLIDLKHVLKYIESTYDSE